MPKMRLFKFWNEAGDEKEKEAISLKKAIMSVQSDFNLEREKERVNATLKKLESESIKLSEKLNNKNFRHKAPKTVIEKFELDQEDLKSKLNKQKSLLEGLEKINN